MAETNTNKKTQLERDIEATAKGLKSVTEKIEQTLPKQEAGFFKIAESIKEANKKTTDSGKEFSETGKLFNQQLEDIVNTSKTASRQDLVVQRKRLNQILDAIKDTVTDESERKAILDNFDLVKKQITNNISFQKELFVKLNEGISRQVSDGIAIIGSIASENPLVGFAFKSIVNLTSGIFTAIKEKQIRDKQIARADLEKIKGVQEQTLLEKKTLLDKEKEKNTETKKEEQVVKQVVKGNEETNILLIDIKQETLTSNKLLESLKNMFIRSDRKLDRTKATEKARATELRLEKKTQAPEPVPTQTIQQEVKSRGGLEGILGVFGISVGGLVAGLGAFFASPVVLGVLGTLLVGGLGLIFKEEIKAFGKALFNVAEQQMQLFRKNASESADLFRKGVSKVFSGDFLSGITDIVSSGINLFVRTVSNILGKFISSLPFVDEDNALVKQLQQFGESFDARKDLSFQNVIDRFKSSENKLEGEKKILQQEKNRLQSEVRETAPIVRQPFRSSLRDDGTPTTIATDQKSKERILQNLFETSLIKQESINSLLQSGVDKTSSFVNSMINQNINNNTSVSTTPTPTDTANIQTDILNRN